MRVLQLSLADGDGGAHIAARRLHLALLAAGVESEMLVDRKGSDAPGVKGIKSEFMRGLASCRPSVDNMLTRLCCHGFKGGAFFSNLAPDFMRRRLKGRRFDLIHLHWVGGGFLKPSTLPALDVPVVWTMHDMWPFTGGCLYSGECRNYEGVCGRCPFCHSNSPKDMASRNQRRKCLSYRKATIHFVAPSNWMATCASNAAVLAGARVSVVRNCVDTTVFAPRDKAMARSVLALPPERRILLFGAVGGLEDSRKGGDLLKTALKKLRELTGPEESPLLLVFGGEKLGMANFEGMDICHVGKIHDEITLSLLYSAADAFAAPSRADNLPNTVIEALACGVSTVAFNIGGMPDIIEGSGGVLVKAFDTDAFADALKATLANASSARELNRALALSRYSMGKVAEAHVKLYSERLATS